MRNYRGSEFNSGYPLCELSLAEFKHIVTPELLAQLIRTEEPVNGLVPKTFGFKGISFNGNLGDFASAHDAVEIVEYIVEHKVPVQINTNGSLRNSAWWSRLALPGVTVGFAIDGMSDTHKLYRQDTDWHRVIEHAQALIAAGGRAVWRFVPFDHNQHQEQECRKLAREMGFFGFENIYDGRDTGPVFTRDGEFTHYIGPTPPGSQPPPIQALIESHVTWYDAKTFRSHKDVPNLSMNCIHKQNQEIYIAADGSVYPCCFLGFYPHTMNHPGNRELAPMVTENNALQYPLEHCLEWFESVDQAWSRSSIAKGRPYQCVSTCGKPTVAATT
jgi:sulfatase maturation enzyme AslB (radical SAM superfamily)